jgi:hypothetical protein
MRAFVPIGTVIRVLSLLACVGGCAHGDRRIGSAAGEGQVDPGDPKHNLLKQSTFSDGAMLPWNTSFSAPAQGEARVKDGALCVQVEQGGI